MPTAESSSSPAPALPAFEVGQKLAGVYVLRKEISGDKESPIWLAHDEVLGKDVSLHFIPGALRADERSMGELRQEIKRNRQLIHPGILRVYDLVDEPDWSAISMDWFEGESLASLLQAKPGGFFEPAEIKPWLQQVCQTLDDIHKIQIVHRDVAPQHIFVDPRGKVLLARFGLGRVMEDAKGRLPGKPAGADARLASLSPQTLDGENPNKLDDIYSLGATMYELLTGGLPFVGPELLAQIRKNPPQAMMERRAKLGKKGGTILPVWEKLVAAALAKGTTERPQSAGELSAKLGLAGRPGAETSPAPLAALASAAAPTPKAEGAVAEKILPVDAGAQGEQAAQASSTAAAGVPAPAEPVEKGASTSTIAAIAAATAPGLVKAAEELRGVATTNKAGEGAPPATRLESTTETPSSSDEKPVKAEAETEPAVVSAQESGTAELASDGEEESDAITPAKRPLAYSPYEESSSSSGRSGLIFAGLAVLVAGGAYYYFNHSPADAPREAAPLAQQATAQPPATPSAPPALAAATPTPAASEMAKVTVGADSSADKLPEKSSSREGGNASPEMLSGEPLLLASADAFDKNPSLLAEARNANRGPETGKIDATPTPPSTLVLTGDADKDFQNATKQKQEAEKAIGDLEKAIQKKTKEIAPILKTSEPLLKQRTQKAESVTAAENEEKAAREAAEAKAQAVEQARKALADWESSNAPKLAIRDKATGEVQALQGSLTVRQKQAADAVQALTTVETARQQAVARKKAEADAEQARLAAQRAAEETERKKAEEARLAAEETSKKAKEIELQIAKMQEQLAALKSSNAGAAPAIAAPAGPGSTAPKATPVPASTPVPKATPPPATPAPATPAPATPAPKATPPPATPAPATPVPSTPPPAVAATPRTIPPAPPSPQPVRSGVQSEFLPPLPAAGSATPAAATPAATPTTLVMIPATPAPHLVPATPAPAGDQPAAPEGADGENSLGMKFAPVGDVSFCVWPTRVKDFEIFAKETGVRNSSWRNPGYKQGPDHPVVYVSWKEAMGFCEWLTARERKKGSLTKDQSYRLPTDLEWSKAVGLAEETGRTPEARDMGVPDVFPWGTQWPPPPNAGNYTGDETGSDVAIKGYTDGFAWTSPVGSFPPNKLGLYDVGGNVWQWCMDNWSADSKAKVLRGASWYNGALKLSLLSSCRVSANPESSSDNYGFRIVKVTEGSKTAKAQ